MGREKRVKSDLAAKKRRYSPTGNGEGGEEEKENGKKQKVSRIPNLAPSPNMLI